MPSKRETGECKCGTLEQWAHEPDIPIEFDAQLNEYHITYSNAGKCMIYFCPFCGGSTPKSRRGGRFLRLTEAELGRLVELTKDLHTVDQVIAAFGEPDLRQAVGVVITKPEKDGKPETTQSYPVLTYRNLSEAADVCVTVYPTNQVGITFEGKPVKRDSGT